MEDTEKINRLIGSCTELTTYFGRVRDGIDADLATMRGSIELYVDAVTGSDGNDGAQLAPLASLGVALDRAKNGGLTRINLKEGQSFGTSGGMTDRDFTMPSTILLSRWGGNVRDDTGRPVVHIEGMVDGSANRPAKMLWAYAPLSFGTEGIDIICDTPADPALRTRWWQEQFIRAGGNLAGMTISVHFFRSSVTATEGRIALCGCRHGENLILGALVFTLTGGASLAYSASRGTATISAHSVTAEDGSSLLDGGAIGENVLTNAPSVTLPQEA